MTPFELIEHRRRLRSLVDKYSHSFPTFSPKQSGMQKEETTVAATVLLSGSTGAFGANILAELVASPTIRRAYAVTRPKQGNTYERHAQALRREGYDAKSILDSPKVRLIEADLSIEGFGVEKDLCEELELSITHVIHNGWKVNFNAPLSEFEPNIRSVRNLVDFCLQTRARVDQPAKIIFVGSIGMFQNADPMDPDRPLPEEHLDQPDCALGMGYAEAKWVSESILDKAARKTALRPTVVRLGQIVGGPRGYWNEKDWFPILIKSSIFLKMLPAVPGVFSWNRTHIKARALLDMLETTERYVHLVNPRPVPETAIITIFARKLCLPVVHIDDWMKVLQRSYDDVFTVAPKIDGKPSRVFLKQAFENNPAVRIFGFFLRVQESCRGKPLRPDTTTACTPLVRCEKAVAASRTLRDPLLPQIGEEDVEVWLESWKTVGFLDHQVIGGVGVRSLL
ncbi:hypothetical protein ACEPAG_1314 [Sanghuangporus baumii]